MSLASADDHSPAATKRSTNRPGLGPRVIKPIFEQSIAIILLLALWELAPRFHLINASFLPPLSEVITYGYTYAISGKLWPHIFVSLQRALGAFALGVVTAVPFGIMLGWHEPLERYLNPLLQFLRQFNSISLLPIFILFFGIGYLTKVAMIYWVVIWPILLSTTSGIKYVDPILIKYGRSLSLSNWQIFSKIIIPSSIPSIISGMRLAATYSFLMLVISEEVGASSGLGYLIFNAQYVVGIQLLYVAVLLLAILGFSANFFLILLERRLTRWKPEGIGILP